MLPDDVSSLLSVGGGARETFLHNGSLTVSDFFFLFGGGLLISSDLLLIVTLLSNKFLECFVFVSVFVLFSSLFSILICFLCRIQTHRTQNHCRCQTIHCHCPSPSQTHSEEQSIRQPT